MHRVSSDLELAAEHEAGTPVQLLLVAEHKEWGTLAYVARRLWVFHYNAAHRAHDELVALHDEVLQLPVDKSDMRTLRSPGSEETDFDLAERIYDAGVRMIVNVVLAVQHLCDEIERHTRAPFSGATIEERVAHATDIVKWENARQGDGWSAFMEIRERRDAVEHPKEGTVIGGEPGTWDRVPLSWLLSERPLVAFEQWSTWFHQLVDAWDAAQERLPSESATLKVERGIKSKRQFKKPSRDQE